MGSRSDIEGQDVVGTADFHAGKFVNPKIGFELDVDTGVVWSHEDRAVSQAFRDRRVGIWKAQTELHFFGTAECGEQDVLFAFAFVESAPIDSKLVAKLGNDAVGDGSDRGVDVVEMFDLSHKPLDLTHELPVVRRLFGGLHGAEYSRIRCFLA